MEERLCGLAVLYRRRVKALAVWTGPGRGRGAHRSLAVEVPPVDLNDQEPQAVVESGEHQQNENHEEEASAAAARFDWVEVPPVDLNDQEPQAVVESGEHQQNENHEEEASAAAASANYQLPGPFSSLESSIEILKKKAQELIENINESRQKDHALMTNFRDNLKMKVTESLKGKEEPMV
ncbi:Synaptonemal complex central element protein 2 [Microtus ochrogaster]|uniref:Synaptonemal complex central element protein 2 n=1 Tax=Microtus ochrogaster TaxID=79684 RepID=A0A8J6GZS5_MICOH|nr:Synaptonemal complex central element protein 2 [Microtus ochrogaster]